MRDVYITGSGSYLPGPPLTNAELPSYTGVLDAKSERLGKFVCRLNGIKTRHYALDKSGSFTHTNAQMAAHAVTQAADHADIPLNATQVLSAGTTLGDLIVPGHASAVHAELNLPPIEIYSFQSVCASSMMAMKNAWLSVASGDKDVAIAVGSECSSRMFRASLYEPAMPALDTMSARMSAEFLRWTLSDGAGALVLQPEPGPGISLKVEWITISSFADQFASCMYAGVPPEQTDDLSKNWTSYDTMADAGAAGTITLMQDMALLKEIFKVWVDEYEDLAKQGKFDPNTVDWLLCHYSAQSLRDEIMTMMEAKDVLVDREKWFSNLPEKGNTGAAAMFIILDEFIKTKKPKSGETIFCIIPESGRALISFMLLTVV